MPSSSAAPLPTWWLRLWIAIGVIVLALIIMIPAVIFTTFTGERHRFDACEKHLRTDCKPSMIWLFSGWVKPASDLLGEATTSTVATNGNTATVPEVIPASTSTLPFEAVREERTSSTAPRITSIKADGALMVQGVYQLIRPTSTVWTVKADGAQTVEFYLKTSGAVNAVSKRILTLKKQKDGSFQGTWKATGVLGELEVRATGAKNAKHSLFFAVAPSS